MYVLEYGHVCPYVKAFMSISIFIDKTIYVHDHMYDLFCPYVWPCMCPYVRNCITVSCNYCNLGLYVWPSVSVCMTMYDFMLGHDFLYVWSCMSKIRANYVYLEL